MCGSGVAESVTKVLSPLLFVTAGNTCLADEFDSSIDDVLAKELPLKLAGLQQVVPPQMKATFNTASCMLVS